MKKFFIVFGCLFFANFLLNDVVFSAPKEPIRVQESVIVSEGKVKETTIVSDENSQLFLEFPENTVVVHKNKTQFYGEIIPPIILDQPNRLPRTRMKEILSFEINGNTGNQLFFVDRYSLMRQENILQEQYNSEEELKRTDNVKLLYKITDENVVSPRLWEYLGDEIGWRRIGGTLENLESKEDENSRIFAVTLKNTGVFSIIDEYPKPTQYADGFVLPKIEQENTEKAEDTSLTNSADSNSEISNDAELPDSKTNKVQMGERNFEIDPITNEVREILEDIPSIDTQEKNANTDSKITNNDTENTETFDENSTIKNTEEDLLNKDAKLPATGPTDVDTQAQTKFSYLTIVFLLAVVGILIGSTVSVVKKRSE